MDTKTTKAFFTFTKKERRGIFVVLACVAAIIGAQYIYPLVVNKNNIDEGDLVKQAALLKEKTKDSTINNYNRYASDDQGYGQYTKKNYDNTFTGNMFYFDPNTLDAAGWKKLGIRDKTIGTIKNYLSKGGKFRQPDDLRKVWGLSDEEKERLVPYARIEAAQTSSYNNTNNYPVYEKKVYEKKAISSVEINNGDSVAFVSLPGIGPGFSKRIINFRNKLGGFYKIEQVAETFGLPDSTYQKIKPFLKINADNIHKINVNTASNDELKAHPYIRWQLANVITEYKKQHGNFTQLQDLKKIMLINEETYNKISPYLSL